MLSMLLYRTGAYVGSGGYDIESIRYIHKRKQAEEDREAAEKAKREAEEARSYAEEQEQEREALELKAAQERDEYRKLALAAQIEKIRIAEYEAREAYETLQSLANKLALEVEIARREFETDAALMAAQESIRIRDMMDREAAEVMMLIFLEE